MVYIKHNAPARMVHFDSAQFFGPCLLGLTAALSGLGHRIIAIYRGFEYNKKVGGGMTCADDLEAGSEYKCTCIACVVH